MDTELKSTRIDPVCGMEVPESSAYRTTRNGETYFFCSDGCRQAFIKRPSEYLIPGNRHHAMPSETMSTGARSTESSDQPSDGAAYVPLFVLVDVALLASTAQEWASVDGWSGSHWMSLFMGWFLALFATQKLFDLKGFADGFQRYDLLAGPVRAYGFLYPFIEFALALSYLSGFRPTWTAIVTAVVMVFGSLGVLRALMRGEKINCACMGTSLNVPLSKVALVENLSMGAMAIGMLWMHHG